MLALLIGWLLLGIAHAAMLPPWEGFDETAHYSSVQQLVTLGRPPSREASFLSADVEAYAEVAPMPHAASPPHISYDTFFKADDEAVARARALVHGPPVEPRRYAPTDVVNWERKHPPLAYLALAPAYLATAHQSLSSHLLALRLAAFVPAWLALVLVVRVCLREARTAAPDEGRRWRWAALGVAVWPALFPGWFADTARLGNDGWAALVASMLWATMVRRRDAATSMVTALWLGILLGLGCLTKAYFLAFAPAVALWVLLRRDAQPGWQARALPAAAVLLVSAAVGGWWYLDNLQPYANVLLARRSGGLVDAVAGRFSVVAWLRGNAALVATVAWPGTWSFARPPYVWFVPLVVSVALGAWVSLRGAWRAPRGDARWVPFWLAVPMAAGLTYYVFVRVAATGEGRIAAGYYLHVLAGPLGTALGVGLAALWTHRAVRLAATVFLAYALAFGAAISWAQTLLFAGVLTKAPDKFYALAGPLPPWFGVPEALQRLGVLSQPHLAVACWAAGGALVLGALAAIAGRLPAADSLHGSPHRAGLRTTHAIR